MKKNIKILWVNPGFLDYRIPLYDQINQLTDKNLTVIYSKNRILIRVHNKIKNCLGTNAIDLLNEKYFHIGKDRKGFANEYLKIPFQPGLLKSIFKTNCDIIIAEGFFQWTPATLIKKIIQKKPLIIAYERTLHTERNAPKWRTLYRKIISKFVDGYIVNGTLSKEYLIKTLKINENKIFLGGMSADNDNLISKIESFTTKQKNEFLNLIVNKKEPLIYLYVGQLIERKGIIELIGSWKIFKNENSEGVLIIVGNGPKRTEIENYIQSKFIDDIIIVGDVDYDQIYKYFAIANLLIIPTLEDNWSLVVPEAMSCKLPIACSIYNGCWPELITQNNGWCFDPLNTDEFVNVLKKIFLNRNNLKQMGDNSFEIVKNYNPKTVAENIISACITTIRKK